MGGDGAFQQCQEGTGEAQVEGEETPKREGARRASTHHIVEADTPALKEDLPGEAIDKGKPELEHKQRDETNNGGRGSVSLREMGGRVRNSMERWPHSTGNEWHQAQTRKAAC